MADGAKSVVGFESEFVEEPPKYIQTECPICLLILREPFQVTCCGKSYCKECIELVKTVKRACPCCKEENYNDFPNKGLQQPLYTFQVHCSNKVDGCEWKGELGQLDNHLNLNILSEENELEGCAFANIKCSYCSAIVIRNSLQHHKNELCDKRPFSCEYCNDYKSTYDDVIHNHWPVCGSHPVQCPNKCGAFPQRQDCEKHVSSDCPLTVVECDFNFAGCEVKLPRKEMPDHIKDSLVPHFSLLALSHKKQQEVIKSLDDEISALKAETKVIHSHSEEISTLKQKQIELEKRCFTGTFPVKFVVQNINQYTGSKKWVSEHFYSHPYGYKLCLQLCRDSSILKWKLLRCCIMKGEFDDQLKWPLNADIEIRIEDEQGRFISLRNISVKNQKQVKYSITEPKKRGSNLTIISFDSNCLNFIVVGVKIE